VNIESLYNVFKSVWSMFASYTLPKDGTRGELVIL